MEIIGEGAFYGCSSLKEIEIPDSVKVMDRGAFFRCSGMRKIRLPELRWIEPDEGYGVALITGCTSLETILAPKETADLIKRGLEVSDFYPQWEDIQIVAEKEEREVSPYAYEVTEEGVVIYGYRGNEKIVEIPEEIEGKPVVALEGDRESHQGFVGEGVKEVILPDTLKRIGA